MGQQTRPGGVTRGHLIHGGYYLTAPEAADELGLAYRTVHAAITDGRIKARRIGPIYLIRAAEVAAYRETTRGPYLPASSPTGNTRRAAVVSQRYPRGAPERPHAVYYRHHDGTDYRIDRARARVLAGLADDREPRAEGDYVAELHDGPLSELTRARIVKLADELATAGLIVRTEGRDRQGGTVRRVHLGARGNDALHYCRDRGLI